MKLIRITLWAHLALHLLLWSLAIGALSYPAAAVWATPTLQTLGALLVVQLGSYHWAMAQWQEDRCEDLSWSGTLLLAVVVFLLGLAALLLPAWSALLITLGVVALLGAEIRGQVALYLQPWYQRLRWILMASLILTQWLMV